MNYSFPKITHIDDVLPAIKDSPEFIVVEKDGYKVVNYVVATQETFPSLQEATDYGMEYDNLMATLRRECRGLIFEPEGALIGRRYHKFFNVGERPETQLDQINWNQPHVILEKLDGSMVSPCRVNGHIRWMTKMGITDTSMEAEAFVATHLEYVALADALLHMDYTPIFEWCSNKNRIVLDYPEDRLVLTAVRFNESGRYWTQEEMEGYAQVFAEKIPVVKAWAPSTSIHFVSSLMDIVHGAEGIEGVVVRFDDGHMVKIKADWYVRIHKVKSLLGQERDVVKLILNNELDDLLPVLPKEDVERVEKFQEKMATELRLNASSISVLINYIRSKMGRKTFALSHSAQMNPLWKSMVFKFWDKECNEHLTYAEIVAIILSKCGNNASYAVVKEAFLKDVDYV